MMNCLQSLVSITFFIVCVASTCFDRLENSKYAFGDVLIRKRDNQTSKVSLTNALPTDDALWPFGVVPVVIHSSLGTYSLTLYPLEKSYAITSYTTLLMVERQIPLIEAAFDHYHEKTCVRFIERTSEEDYIHLIKDSGCYSEIGRKGGVQTLSLDDGCHCKGTIVHELMHALGFYHEQNRSDRDDYIYIVWENIEPNATKEFIKLSPSEERTFSVGYDYHSIMQYAHNAFSADGRDTMIPLRANVELLHPCLKGSLSPLDVIKIEKLYGCP